MADKTSKILLTLVGDIKREVHVQVKYGFLADALDRNLGKVIPCDVSLRGTKRWLNMLHVFHPNLALWREKFWKNLSAFDARSRIVAEQVSEQHPDFVLQVGVTFDASLYQSDVPVFIYTDYTASLSARRLNNLRSPFSDDERRRWLEREKEAYQQAVHIFVRSCLVRDMLEQDYSIAREKISMIGGGVNFYPLPDVVRARGKTNSPLVLFIGKDFIRKGGDFLLKAFALVRKEIPDSRLRLVTGDMIPVGLPLGGVEVQRPIWDRNSVAQLYRDADIFVLPSRLETWGDVLLEAMAFGLPCIGVQSDAMCEIISDHETGLLIPPESPGALATAMISLLCDPTLCARMGAAGRQRIEALFTWDQVVTNMRPVIHKLVS